MSVPVIAEYIHCVQCLKDIPEGISPNLWTQTDVGYTDSGIQVWCKRHECSVVHIDLDESKHKPHLMDLYKALGVKWGDDPFPVIERLSREDTLP